MKRILLMVLRNLWFVPYGWFKLCYTAVHVEKYTEEERYQSWAEHPTWTELHPHPHVWALDIPVFSTKLEHQVSFSVTA